MCMKIIKIALIILSISIIILISNSFYNDYKKKHAKIEIQLVDNLNIEVYSKIKISDLIKKINGKIIKNKEINTKKLGPKTIKFSYINSEQIKITYSFKINIVDTIPPVISDIDTININEGYNGNIENKVFCADNYDKKPVCKIEGEYDINKKGKYNVLYKAKDSSNNTNEKQITINVEENKNNKTATATNFSDIYAKFKKKNTKIGIDVSYHQGDIDYQKVKEAGVEFVIIRVGYGKNSENKFVVDKKFKDYIKGFQTQNIPIGIYFFSYAENKKEAIESANFVQKQIKNYKIDLPIIFDWENWSDFKEYHLSIHDVNEIAQTFNKKLEEKGYKTMIYSSKNFIKYVWGENNYNIWVAHYNENNNYEGIYKIWQICDDGKIDGINGNIDIDIMYE